jgi:hypothetical protein
MIGTLKEFRGFIRSIGRATISSKKLARSHVDGPATGRPPTLPDGWLQDPDELVHLELEDAFSGG